MIESKMNGGQSIFRKPKPIDGFIFNKIGYNNDSISRFNFIPKVLFKIKNLIAGVPFGKQNKGKVKNSGYDSIGKNVDGNEIRLKIKVKPPGGKIFLERSHGNGL